MTGIVEKKRNYVTPSIEILTEEQMLARFQVSTSSISWWF